MLRAASPCPWRHPATVGCTWVLQTTTHLSPMSAASSACSRACQVPEETQFLLLELAGHGGYVLMLPLIDGGAFRATLRAGCAYRLQDGCFYALHNQDRSGSAPSCSRNTVDRPPCLQPRATALLPLCFCLCSCTDGKLCLRIESGTADVVADSWRSALLVAAGSEPYELVNRAVAAAARLSGNAPQQLLLLPACSPPYPHNTLGLACTALWAPGPSSALDLFGLKFCLTATYPATQTPRTHSVCHPPCPCRHFKAPWREACAGHRRPVWVVHVGCILLQGGESAGPRGSPAAPAGGERLAACLKQVHSTLEHAQARGLRQGISYAHARLVFGSCAPAALCQVCDGTLSIPATVMPAHSWAPAGVGRRRGGRAAELGCWRRPAALPHHRRWLVSSVARLGGTGPVEGAYCGPPCRGESQFAAACQCRRAPCSHAAPALQAAHRRGSTVPRGWWVGSRCFCYWLRLPVDPACPCRTQMAKVHGMPCMPKGRLALPPQPPLAAFTRRALRARAARRKRWRRQLRRC